MNNNDQFPYSILFIDDEQMARKYFAKAVSKDFNVLTAANVSEAREILEHDADRIGVLVTDQRMPDENGVVLLKHAREYYPHIVRLLTTAYSDLGDAIEAINSGEILRYIHKPWNLPELQAELKHAMRFFELQKENQELMREKLNVIQRMIEVNRVRDLLVMGAGFSLLRHSNQGMLSFLMQVPTKTTSASTDLAGLDMWSLMEKEITEAMNLAVEIIARTNGSFGQGGQFGPVDYCRLWSAVLESAGVVEARRSGLAAIKKLAAKGNDAQLKLLFNSMMTSCVALGGNGLVTKASAIDGTVEFKVESPDTTWEGRLSPTRATSELLAAFLIASHHGGELNLLANSKTGAGLVVTLPLSPEKVELPAPNPHWLDHLLARYEGL